MTYQQRWLSRRYLIYRTLTGMWFISAIWLYLYRLFITDQQVGVLDGLAFAIGVLAEVPSGALADKFGRNKIVRIGLTAVAAGLLIQAFSSYFFYFVVGQSVLMIGLSLISGADEALFFEKLRFGKDSTDWRKLVTRGSQLGLIGALIATVVGGLIHNFNPRVPWVLNGLMFFAGLITVWVIKDVPSSREKQRFWHELKSYFIDIKTGFAQFSLPELKIYVPFIITVQGIFYTTGYGLLRLILLDRFGFSPLWGSIAVAASNLITVGLLAYIHKNADALSEKRVLTLIGLSAAASLLLSLASIGYWGYIVILSLYAGEHLLQPIMSEALNRHAVERQRATVLSVASFFKSVPYVALAPIIGYLNTVKQLNYFLLVWALLIMAAVGVYMLTVRRSVKIVTTNI